MSQDIELEPEDSNEELYEHRVIKTDKGQEPYRIDKFLMNRIEGATRNKIQQALEAGLITVNGQPVKPNFKVKANHEIIIYSTDQPNETDVVPEKMDINIIYEDDAVMVIDKPAGMVVHPGSGNYSGTLLNGIAYYLKQKNPNLDESVLPRYGLVHRIDKNTSGLLLMAKTAQAATYLAKQFFDHTIERKYRAVVWGDFDDEEGTVVAHVGRNQRFRKLFEAYPEGEYGKDAVTHYRVLERFNYVTLIECILETGRTHQIRVHMKHIGHTLFGDDTYGGNKILKGTIFSKYKQFVDNCLEACPRQALHAFTLGFKHPVTEKDMFFESPLPTDMTELIDKWRRYVKGKGSLEQ
jgi:23S rRNA pseudouridine1911/1915/1917 synthase